TCKVCRVNAPKISKVPCMITLVAIIFHDLAFICPYINKPSSSSLRKCSQFAQSPTKLELASSTRGAHSLVFHTPTGLPDCTSKVSSASRSSACRQSRQKIPSCGQLCRCRHRPQGLRGVRQLPGRGCSSACARALRFASF